MHVNLLILTQNISDYLFMRYNVSHGAEYESNLLKDNIARTGVSGGRCGVASVLIHSNVTTMRGRANPRVCRPMFDSFDVYP